MKAAKGGEFTGKKSGMAKGRKDRSLRQLLQRDGVHLQELPQAEIF
jgi:hypothetical protein